MILNYFIQRTKCLKKVRKTNSYSFFLPSYLLITFTKCNAFTNNNQPKKPNIVQVQLATVA